MTHSGLAYVGDHKSRVHVYAVRIGTEVATYEIGPHLKVIWSSNVVDKDYRVYFAGQNGHVYGVSPAGWCCLTSASARRSTPTRH